MKFLKKILGLIPIFLTALILAFVVWVSAVTRRTPTKPSLTAPQFSSVIGLNPDLVITDQSAKTVMITVRAPRSVHDQLARNLNRVSARVNLNGLDAGTYELTPEINIGFRPTQLVEVNPPEVTLTLEQVATETVDILLLRNGSLPIGYEASEPFLSTTEVQMLGPRSKLMKS